MEDKKATLQQPQTAEAIFQEAENYRRQENYIKAHELYMEAARQNHKEAQLKLGWMYEYGKGVPQDPAEAQRWYSEARINQKIEQCSIMGFKGRANIYKQRLVNKNKRTHQDVNLDKNSKSRKQKINNKNNERKEREYSLNNKVNEYLVLKKYSQWGLDRKIIKKKRIVVSNNGNIYVKDKYITRLDLLNDRKLKENKVKANSSGTTIINKANIENDIKIFESMKKLSLCGNVEAQFNLGSFYEYGKGVRKNYEEACIWYEKAAEKGHVGAQFHLGLLYGQCKNIIRDYDKACKWYKKAALQGHVQAMSNLKAILQLMQEQNSAQKKASIKNKSSTMSLIDEIKYYEELVTQGNNEAKAKLALLYKEDSRGNMNRIDVYRIYQQLAIQGYANAQFKLATLYEEGKYSTKSQKELIKFHKNPNKDDYNSDKFRFSDYKEAMRLYQMAYRKGINEAKFRIISLSKKISEINKKRELLNKIHYKIKKQKNKERKRILKELKSL